MSSLLAQELPKSDNDAFEVEPPLLVPLGAQERRADESREELPETERDAGKLEQQLERAKKSAASAERLVKMGVLAKVEAEQRGLRVVRLEAALANARMIAAKEQVTLQEALGAAGQTDFDAARATLARASAAAQAATENYRKAQLDAAALDLRRQRQLHAQGSARKSDVARAEEKLATLQRDDRTSH
ncbi:MAG: hypothetical protein ABIR38_07270 [Chthoniobacterales bacterium]